MTILENRKESFKSGLSCGNELWLVRMLQKEDKFLEGADEKKLMPTIRRAGARRCPAGRF